MAPLKGLDGSVDILDDRRMFDADDGLARDGIEWRRGRRIRLVSHGW